VIQEDLFGNGVTFWVTISYSENRFILIFPVWKL
jgi:hypothetical protein